VARRIVWTESAWQEVECAASFISRDSPRYAAALVDEVRSAARSLRKFPKRGRVVIELNDENVRELIVKSYRLIYEIELNRTVILAFLHGARGFPVNL
jgi:toxin ParE1/3/4